jgi:hypothetical protein
MHVVSYVHLLVLLCRTLVLKHNSFTFNGEHFLQINGTAMGTKMAPSYTNIFMWTLLAWSKKRLRFSSHSVHFMSTSSMKRNQESGLWGADYTLTSHIMTVSKHVERPGTKESLTNHQRGNFVITLIFFRLGPLNVNVVYKTKPGKWLVGWRLYG